MIFCVISLVEKVEGSVNVTTLEVDLVKYEQEMPRQNTYFVSHNFELKTQYYGTIGWHANNCSTFLAQQIVIRCNDGWLALGRLFVFFDAADSKNDGKAFDFET